jgi:hypothetical protein
LYVPRMGVLTDVNNEDMIDSEIIV